MKKITDLTLRILPTEYQKAVIMDFKKDFEDMSFLYDANGTTVYAICSEGLVSIDRKLHKAYAIKYSIN